MVDVEYLRANRTIETIQLSNNGLTKTVAVFNYECVHYRVFEDIADAYKVASGETDIKVLAEFTKENELDHFLQNIVL